MRSEILIHARGAQPTGSEPASFEGLRAAALAAGLESHGLDVRIVPDEDAAFDAASGEKAAALILVQAARLERLPGDFKLPLIVDLPSPAALGGLGPPAEVAARLRLLQYALRRADLVTVASRRGRAHVTAWLQQGGSGDAPSVMLVPHCIAPVEVSATPDRNKFRVVCEEAPLPGMSGHETVERVAACLAEIENAELVLLSDSVDRGRQRRLPDSLGRVAGHRLGPRRHATMLGRIATAQLAICVESPTATREIDLPPRVLDYAAAGVPTLVDSAVELGELLKEKGAGFVVNADRRGSLERQLKELAEDRKGLSAVRRKAARLAAGELAPVKATAELGKFCALPNRRLKVLAAGPADDALSTIEKRQDRVERSVRALEDGFSRQASELRAATAGAAETLAALREAQTERLAALESGQTRLWDELKALFEGEHSLDERFESLWQAHTGAERRIWETLSRAVLDQPERGDAGDAGLEALRAEMEMRERRVVELLEHWLRGGVEPKLLELHERLGMLEAHLGRGLGGRVVERLRRRLPAIGNRR